MHTVTLFIPSLLWPEAGAAHEPPAVPALRTLMARGDAGPAVRCDDESAWLCSAFGIERQLDWPSAPISVFGAGMPPGSDYWLGADPVHLNVQRDRMILSAPESLQIEDAEAVSLCAALNRHFEADRFHFLAPHPERWFVRTGRPVRIHTRGLTQAVGRDVDHLLPEGEERLQWHRVFNEVQMLLHDHPVNTAREARGAPVINSLWFSGGGTLPLAQARHDAIVGSSALAQGLAKLAGVPFIPASRGVEALSADQVLVECDDAMTGFLRLDHEAWKSALEILERLWFAPLADLLRGGRLKHLEIATVSGGHGYRWSVRRSHLWRFWRSPVPLSDPLARK